MASHGLSIRNRNAAALLEIGLLYLPAIPVYIWLWPNFEGNPKWIAQSLSYL